MKLIPFLLLFLVLIGCNSPPIEPIDDKPPTEHTVPKEKQPDEKPVERREPPPIDKREVVPEDGGNEQIPDKPIPSCPANGLKITSINGTGSAREPSEVPSSLTDVRKATNRLQDKLVVTGSGLSKVSRVEIKELKTTLMMTVTKDTEMTIQLSRGLGLKAGLYTLLFYLSATSVCSAQVFLLQGEGFTKSQQTQIAALLKLVKVNGKDVTVQADAFKVQNSAGDKDIVSVDTKANGSFTTNVKVMKVAFGGKDYFKVDTDAKKANFDGLNVQITNGTNQTDSTNGVGNLIIGYNETRSSTVASKDRTGSHYLILGSGAHYTGYAGIVAGKNNTVNGNFASVLGGQFNLADGDYSAVVAGGGINVSEGNKAYGQLSVIIGGQGNTIGDTNDAKTGASSVIVSGKFNKITGGEFNSVSGGQSNTASGSYSSVSGGRSNNASGDYSSVSGGQSNTASGSYSSVLGGQSNTASKTYSSVLGGQNNTTSNNHGIQPKPAGP